jgi:hypothetical protein
VTAWQLWETLWLLINSVRLWETLQRLTTLWDSVRLWRLCVTLLDSLCDSVWLLTTLWDSGDATLWDSETLLLINSVRLCVTATFNSVRLWKTLQSSGWINSVRLLSETLCDCWMLINSVRLSVRLLINSVRLWDFTRLLTTLWDALLKDFEDFARLLINSVRLSEETLTTLWLWDFTRLLINSVRLWDSYKTVGNSVRLLRLCDRLTTPALWDSDCWQLLWDSERLCVTVD